MRHTATPPSAMRLVFFGMLLFLGTRIAARTVARVPASRWRALARIVLVTLPRTARWLRRAEAIHRAFRASAQPAPTGLSSAEARRILGVAAGATRETINRAYRDLMRRHHPDQGGSAERASRINAARDCLLGEAVA